MRLRGSHIFQIVGPQMAVRLSALRGGSRPDGVNEFFSIYLIPPAALRPRVYSVSNRNMYRKQNNYVSGEQRAAGV
jgi:hypothetical protein